MPSQQVLGTSAAWPRRRTGASAWWRRVRHSSRPFGGQVICDRYEDSSAPTMQRIIRKLDDLNVAGLVPEEVRTATIVRLPFHLCTGSVFRFVDPDQDRVEIWLRNKLSIPADVDIHEAFRICGIGTSPDDFLTDALLVNRRPDFRSGEFEAIKNNNAAAIGFASPKNPGFRLLNEVIAAHQMVRVGPYVSGLGAMWPRMLSERGMFQRVIGEVVLIACKDRTLIDGDVSRLFQNLDQLPLGLAGGGVGDLRDFSSQQISELETAVRKLRNHAFYELKTNAITAMLSGDSVVAIVLACAALEGVHGAFLRLVLKGKIPGEAGNFLVLTDSGVIKVTTSPAHSGDYVVGWPGSYTTPGVYHNDKLQKELQPGKGLRPSLPQV